MKRFLVIFLIAFLVAPLGLNPAFAGTLTGGDYKMYVNPTTAGGGTLTGGDYTLQDSKGDPLGGKMTGGGYIFEFGNLPSGVEVEVLTILTDELPSGPLGMYYIATLEASAGTPPYVWIIGGLPTGLTRNENGEIYGIPYEKGDFEIPVTVKDAEGTVVKKNFVLTIGPALPLVIVTDALPDGTVKQDYSEFIEAAGGMQPYKVWKEKDLPSGLKLNDQTGEIFGVPDVKGDYVFQALVIDFKENYSEWANIAITINPEGVEQPPAGTVRLFITRQANGVQLSWETGSGAGQVQADVEPNFYYLASKAENPIGIYTNDQTKWDPLVAGADFDIFPKDAHALHAKQVGEGNSEVYYKALLDADDKATLLPVAWAVGKVNVTIAGSQGWSLISMPFMDVSSDVNELIGDQGNYTMGGEIATSVLMFGFKNGGFNKGSYFDDTNWVVIPGLPEAATYTGDQGLYIKTKATDENKIITLVGKVKPLNSATAYTIKNNWNLMSFPYPIQLDINDIYLDIGMRSDNTDNADLVFGFKNGGFNSGSYLNAAGRWTTIPGIPGVGLLNVAKPIYYYSKTVGDLEWGLTPSALGD